MALGSSHPYCCLFAWRVQSLADKTQSMRLPHLPRPQSTCHLAAGQQSSWDAFRNEYVLWAMLPRGRSQTRSFDGLPRTMLPTEKSAELGSGWSEGHWLPSHSLPQQLCAPRIARSFHLGPKRSETWKTVSVVNSWSKSTHFMIKQKSRGFLQVSKTWWYSFCLLFPWWVNPRIYWLFTVGTGSCPGVGGGSRWQALSCHRLDTGMTLSWHVAEDMEEELATIHVCGRSLDKLPKSVH